MLVPYVYDSNEEDYVLGQNVYDISAIIGDSIVLEQSEGTTETKENEFVASPLLQVTSGAKYGFTAQCLDLQNAVLKSIFSAMVASGGQSGAEVTGAAAFADDYVLQYALIRVRFSGDNTPDVFLPKVQLNSRLFIQQLHSRAGQGNIAGTAISHIVAIEDTNVANHLLQFSIPSGVNRGTPPTPTPPQPSMVSTSYTPYTPVLFVPKGYTPIFKYNERNFASVNFGTGNVDTNIIVNATSGTWSQSASPNYPPVV